jgi:geranylgeranyl transferase type-2 subunit beta
MLPYLAELTMRLAGGLGEWDETLRMRHSRWLCEQQQSDGGFRGREGSSDLYYTSFALRSLAILGELHGQRATRAADFLVARLQSRESIVDALSLIYSAALLEASAGIDVFADGSPAWRKNVAEWFATLRRADGGYAKGDQGAASSTYQTFLVLLCFEILQIEVPQPEQIVSFLLSQRSVDGGFREIRASKRSGTNPTAAAIGALRILGALDDDIRDGVADFLLDMQTDEGGLRANTRIPIADLLSTFTGLLTLTDVGGRDQADEAAIRRYALSLQVEHGGFRGAELDFACDVEYTFYGLGTLGLVGPKTAGRAEE